MSHCGWRVILRIPTICGALAGEFMNSAVWKRRIPIAVYILRWWRGWLDMVPAVPPELMLLPNWFAINIYEMSSWTRGIVIPLTILYARKPCFTVPGGVSVDALYKDPSRKGLAFDWDRQLSAGGISFCARPGFQAV